MLPCDGKLQLTRQGEEEMWRAMWRCSTREGDGRRTYAALHLTEAGRGGVGGGVGLKGGGEGWGWGRMGTGWVRLDGAGWGGVRRCGEGRDWPVGILEGEEVETRAIVKTPDRGERHAS